MASRRASGHRQHPTRFASGLAAFALVLAAAVGGVLPAHAVFDPSAPPVQDAPASPLLTLTAAAATGGTGEDGEDGTMSPTNLRLTASGPTTISGVVGSLDITAATVLAGEYALSASGPDGDPGDISGEWSCSGAALEGNVVTVNDGDVVTCTLQGNEVAPDTGEEVIPDEDVPAEEEVVVDDDVAVVEDGEEQGAVGEASAAADVESYVDLEITTESDPVTTGPFSEVDYRIMVRNIGTADVPVGDTVTVRQQLPPTAIYASGPTACSDNEGIVTCDIPASKLTIGAASGFDLVIVFGPDTAPGEHANLVYVDTASDPVGELQCPTGDAPTGVTTSLNNVACASTTVNVNYALSLEKQAYEGDEVYPTNGIAKFGDFLFYLINVYNSGDGTLTDVIVTDVVPDGLIVNEDEIGCLDDGQCDVTYDAATRTITWGLGPLDPGEGVELGFIVDLPAEPAVEPGETVTFVAINRAEASANELASVFSNRVRVKATVSAPLERPELPDTGADTVPLAMGAAGLAVAGLVLVVMARRRRD